MVCKLPLCASVSLSAVGQGDGSDLLTIDSLDNEGFSLLLSPRTFPDPSAPTCAGAGPKSNPSRDWVCWQLPGTAVGMICSSLSCDLCP